MGAVIFRQAIINSWKWPTLKGLIAERIDNMLPMLRHWGKGVGDNAWRNLSSNR
jgi:hypothetical protein